MERSPDLMHPGGMWKYLATGLALLLTQSAWAENCQPLRASAGLKLYQCDQLRLLYLNGSPVERAKAMGGLIRDGGLSSEVMRYFSNKVQDLAATQAPGFRAIIGLAYNQAVRLLHRGTPRDMAEEVDAMAAAMGVDGIDLRRALSLPDTGALANALGSIPLFRPMPASGCTSVAWKNSGGFYYGRNLDFAGTGVWDKHPLLTVILPSGGEEQKHAVFGADGDLFGGITGVNEAGISFAVHQNYTDDGGLRGTPMIFIGEAVLRHARTIDEGIEILRKLRPAVLWTFVLTNLHSGEAVAVESSSRRFQVRTMEGDAFVQTNHLMNKETKDAEFVSTGIKMNSIYRMKRAFELMEAMPKSDPLAGIAGILSYQENPDGRLAAYHDILKAHTIQTVLLENTGNSPRAFLSLDPAPTSGGRMAGFDLAGLWGGTTQFEIRDFVKTPPEKRLRQRQISDAFSLYFDQHKFSEAAALLEGHNTLDSAFFKAVTLTQQDQWGESLALLEKTLSDPRLLAEPAYVRQSLAWIKTAALWQLGKKNDAQLSAQALLAEDPANVRLREFCELVIAGKNPPQWMMKFSFDFFSGDLHGRAN